MKIQYLSLLRGINVGGNNIIRMHDLKECFGSLGMSDVQTYIQSGNVLFKSDYTDKTKLLVAIENALSERFSYRSKIVLLTKDELYAAVTGTPAGFGAEPELYRYDVAFLKEPVTAIEAIKTIRLREGVDTADAGPGVLFFSRLISKAGQSYMSKIITLPVYQHMTIRNWNTTTKLLEMMETREVRK